MRSPRTPSRRKLQSRTVALRLWQDGASLSAIASALGVGQPRVRAYLADEFEASQLEHLDLRRQVFAQSLTVLENLRRVSAELVGDTSLSAADRNAAIRSSLAVEERLAKMWGLDQPEKLLMRVEHEIPMLRQAMEIPDDELEREIADLAQPLYASDKAFAALEAARENGKKGA